MPLTYSGGNVVSISLAETCKDYLDSSGGNVMLASASGYAGTIAYLEYSGGNVVRTSASVDCTME